MMMIMFDFNKKKEINHRKLTEFSCLSLTLGGAELHSLGEKTYGMPDRSYQDDWYRDVQCQLTTFKRAMKSEIKEEFLGKSDMAIVKHVGEHIKSFKDENFREDFLPAVHLIKEEWAKFITDEFGEFLKEKDGARTIQTALVARKKHAARLHSATVTLQSASGGGSTFKVRFPLG